MKALVWNIGNLNSGRHLSDNVRHKISLRLKEGYARGRTVWNKGKSMPEDVRRKISIAKKGVPSQRKGIPRTPEERRAISLARMGIAAWNKGIPRTNEEKKKMSEGAKRMWARRRIK